MHKVGDLVVFKRSNINRDRYNPNKALGLIIRVEKGAVKSLWGRREDVVTVKWFPWIKDERVMAFYLEPLGKSC